jgi:hypothetical protein
MALWFSLSVVVRLVRFTLDDKTINRRVRYGLVLELMLGRLSGSINTNDGPSITLAILR